MVQQPGIEEGGKGRKIPPWKCYWLRSSISHGMGLRSPFTLWGFVPPPLTGWSCALTGSGALASTRLSRRPSGPFLPPRWRPPAPGSASVWSSSWAGSQASSPCRPRWPQVGGGVWGARGRALHRHVGLDGLVCVCPVQLLSQFQFTHYYCAPCWPSADIVSILDRQAWLTWSSSRRSLSP